MATRTRKTSESPLLRELARALDALERTTGVSGRVVAIEPEARRGHRSDALIEISVEGKKHRYAVQARTRVDRLAALGNVKAQFDQSTERGLLFAPYITATMAKQCRELDLAFLDIAGNAYLHEPGLHVYITGEKPEGLATSSIGVQGGGTASALRIVFALLCKPELLNAPYRDIVEAANVALGAIGWVFFDLERRGYIAAGQKKHNRRFLEPIRLFEEWVTNFPIKLRPKLNPRRFRSDTPGWWMNADLTDLRAYWGGEIAAHRMTNHLKPATCTLYLEPATNQAEPTRRLAKFVAASRLRADSKGDIEILDAFWNLPREPACPDTAPPILVYADLVATLDPRNLEIAKLIREQSIEDALRSI